MVRVCVCVCVFSKRGESVRPCKTQGIREGNIRNPRESGKERKSALQ